MWCQYHGTGWPINWSSGDYGIVWYKFSSDSRSNWSSEVRVSQNDSIDPIDLPDQGANYVKAGEYRVGFCALWLDKRDGNKDLYFRNSLHTMQLETNVYTLCQPTGSTIHFTLTGGVNKANRDYAILGSVTGTSPGLPQPGGLATLPLNYDDFTNLVVVHINSPVFSPFAGTLDNAGAAYATLDSQGPVDRQVVGLVMYFAGFCYNTCDFVSNTVVVEIND